MFAGFLRVAQLVEMLAYVALAAALAPAGIPDAATLAAWILAWLVGVRLVLVALSMALGWIFRAPRPAAQQIGALRTLAMLVVEWRALLMTNLVYMPWERQLLRPDRELPDERVPILLVHGYFANRGYFVPLVRRLEAAGVGPIFAPNFRSWLASLERFEEELHAAIERVTRATGASRVILITHSMGGLAARAYLARHGRARVARLVTIAAPHHGTALAALGVGRNARQMERGCAFLEALARAEASAEPMEALAIYSPHDNMVAPQTGALLPWARAIAVPGFGHIAIAGCAPVAALVRAEIEHAQSIVARATRQSEETGFSE